MGQIKKIVELEFGMANYPPMREFGNKLYCLSALAPSRDSANRYIEKEKKHWNPMPFRPLKTRIIKRNTKKDGIFFEVWIYQP